MTKKSNGPTVASKVRELLNNPTLSAKEIAKKLGTTTQYVHTIAYMDKKKAGTVRKVGRPRKFVTPVVEMPIQEPPAKNPVTLNLLRQTSAELQQIRMDQMEREIENLKTIIRYLEGKVYGAPV